MDKLTVIGGGLAGAEAAWQAAECGIAVDLYEMRPVKQTGAHTSGWLAELVCSNSLGSNLIDRAAGLLKEELRILGSVVLECAEQAAVPAGGALAVDRYAFAQNVTVRLENHPNIRIIREEATEIPGEAVIIASGPLTSESLSLAIVEMLGYSHLYFYDAIAPIIRAETINMELAFKGSRYGRGQEIGGDYINCPMDRDQYDAFVQALVTSERIELRDFERDIELGVHAGAHEYFEGCLPLEILATRSPQALVFGPLRPVGFSNQHLGTRPFAVVQLRQDNIAGSLYNMVGFQTNLTFHDQKIVFRMIPGLEEAEFERFGQMHRNTFIYSPAHLLQTLQVRGRNDLFFAGQITGVEGYVGNVATGLLAGWNAARVLRAKDPITLPIETMLGALCYYITHASPGDFQPMKANFGLLPPLEGEKIRSKSERGREYALRSIRELIKVMEATGKPDSRHVYSPDIRFA